MGSYYLLWNRGITISLSLSLSYVSYYYSLIPIPFSCYLFPDPLYDAGLIFLKYFMDQQ